MVYACMRDVSDVDGSATVIQSLVTCRYGGDVGCSA